MSEKHLQITTREIKSIPIREVLHYLGWHGTKVEPEILERIKNICSAVSKGVVARVISRSFDLRDALLAGTNLRLKGQEVAVLLRDCEHVILFAASLGIESERMLLKTQTQSATEAVIMDAVLSAAIETICDEVENEKRKWAEAQGYFLTDRYSPGYGDMPVEQTKEICSILDADRKIGLSVTSSGIMIPRKSVTAIMGISAEPVLRRATRCETCSMRDRCSMKDSQF